MGALHEDLRNTQIVNRRFLVIYSKGCSGSSSIIKTLTTLLRCLNVSIALFGDHESLKPEKNSFYIAMQGRVSKNTHLNREWPIARTAALTQNASLRGWPLVIAAMDAYAASRNTTFLIKGEPEPGTAGGGQIYVGRKRGRFSFAYRNNVLDRTVCNIRDCFPTVGERRSLQYPTLDGNRSNVCFARRKHNVSGVYQAHLDAPHLVQSLKGMQKHHEAEVEYVRKGTGYKGTPQSMETLMQFTQSQAEGTASKLNASSFAWSTILTDFKVPHNISRVRACLAPKVGTFSPGSQRKAIHNWEEVASVLGKHPGLQNMLRP